jgi:hypothetical protein
MDVVWSHLQAPVGVMTVCIRGKVKLRIPATQDTVSEMSLGRLDEMLTERVVDAHGPCHSLLSLNGGEHLS